MNSSDVLNNINIFDNAIIYIYKYVLLGFYIIGNIGNFLSFIVFLKKSWKKNVCVFYFKVCLIYNTCYLNSTTLGIILINGFQINLHHSNIILCKLYFYASLLFATLSPTVLILASIDRLLISSQNVDTRLYSSKRLAYFSISISTCFWILFNTHALIKVNINEISPSHFVCSYDYPVSYRQFVSYSFGVINVAYCLLMIILCLVAFKNVRHIRSIPLREKRQQIRTMTKKDFELLRCLYVHDIIFIIFGTMTVIYYIHEAMTKDQIRNEWNQGLMKLLNKCFTCLFNISYSTNFFVFLMVSKAFRHELKRMTYKIISKNLIPVREEEPARTNNPKLDIISTIELQN